MCLKNGLDFNFEKMIFMNPNRIPNRIPVQTANDRRLSRRLDSALTLEDRKKRQRTSLMKRCLKDDEQE